MTMTEDDPGGPGPRGGARRTELIALACGLFRERGYHGVGMRAIAEAADMRAASLYHHFRGKEELLLEAVDVVSRELYDHQMALLDGPGTHAERLVAVIHRHIGHLATHRDAWWVASRELRGLSPDNAAVVRTTGTHYRRRVADHIADGVEAGEFCCRDPGLSARAMIDMIDGVNEWFDSDGALSVDAVAEHYADLVLRQLRPDP